MKWSVLGALPGEIFLINKSQVHERPNRLATKCWAAEIIETAFTHFFHRSSSLRCPAEKERREPCCSGIKANNKRVSEVFFSPFCVASFTKNVQSGLYLSECNASHPAGRFIANQIASNMQIITNSMKRLRLRLRLGVELNVPFLTTSYYVLSIIIHIQP